MSSNKLPPISEIATPNLTKTCSKLTKTAPFQSPTDVLTSQFTHTLSVKSPPNEPSMNPVLNPVLLKFTSQRLQSTNDGLNSILDPSPVAVVPCKKKTKIRRQSLSQYYGSSVYSPNLREVPGELITVRRSPRLASECLVLYLYPLVTSTCLLYMHVPSVCSCWYVLLHIHFFN